MENNRVFFAKRLVGEGVEHSFELPTPSKWTVVQKLAEEPYQYTEQDVTLRGRGPPYSAARLLCENPNDPNQKAFMRIYMQIPYEGTEIEPPETRAQQASSRSHSELDAFKAFTKLGSTVTPKLLAYKETTQDEGRLVPGGYITYIVELYKLGFIPGFPGPENLVWEPSTRKVYFVGFQRCVPAEESLAWKDNKTLVGWWLALPPERWWWDRSKGTEGWEF